MADRHDWNSWDGYLSTHITRIRSFDYFIISDELEAIQTAYNVIWRGTLFCEGGIEIHVRKLQEVAHRAERCRSSTWALRAGPRLAMYSPKRRNGGKRKAGPKVTTDSTIISIAGRQRPRSNP